MGHGRVTRVVAAALLLLAAAPAVAAEDESAYWRVEDVSIPKEAFLEVGGIAFTPDGTLYVCSRRGEIWARKKSGDWSLWTAGLHEPVGLLAMGDGDLIVAQRPELTRVRDTDHDGRPDRFETLTSSFGISGNYHEYHFGPVRDKQGNFYATLNLAHVPWQGHVMGSAAPYRGWAYKLTAKGDFIPYASGFRSPSGIGLSPKGELFVLDNQGDWMATSPLFQLKPGAFYGHPCSLRWTKDWTGPAEPCDAPPETYQGKRTLPVVWFPYGVAGHSPSEPVWDTTGGKFGPFKGHMFVGDQTKSFVHRVVLEKVGGEYQGVVLPFHRGFGSGITRMRFDAAGTLWVGGTDRGWGATGGKPYALQRVSWTGKLPFEIDEMKLTKTGFDLVFTKPVDAKAAADPARYSLQHYRFNYWRTYGSPHVDVTPVTVSAVKVSPDRKRVSLTLPDLVKERVYELHLRDLPGGAGEALLHDTAYYTLNRLP